MIKVAPCLHSAIRRSAYDTILALEVVSCLLLISVFFNTMPKTRRMAYTAQFKRDAIKLGDEVGKRKAAQQLGINESMMRKWRAQRVPLSTANNSRKSFCGHKPRWLLVARTFLLTVSFSDLTYYFMILPCSVLCVVVCFCFFQFARHNLWGV